MNTPNRYAYRYEITSWHVTIRHFTNSDVNVRHIARIRMKANNTTTKPTVKPEEEGGERPYTYH